MTPTARIDSLHLLETACWQELERAVGDRQHDWRLMTVATVDGEAADARTVVLREARRATRTLRFYSDARAPKVRQLARNPLGTLLLWSNRLGWQLRVRVRMHVATGDAETSPHWARVRLTPNARDYLSFYAPGSELPSALSATPAAREHFAIVTADVLWFDWLELHPDGSRRARFEPGGARWLQP